MKSLSVFSADLASLPAGRINVTNADAGFLIPTATHGWFPTRGASSEDLEQRPCVRPVIPYPQRGDGMIS